MDKKAESLPKLGARTTRQREAVIEVLTELENFSSAKTIHQELRARNITVGLTTVYRTLQFLVAMRTVDELRMANGETLYRHCMNNGHHHHLVCTQCGYTIEIEGGPVERWAHSIAHQYSFHLTGHDAEIYGICRRCTGKNA